MLSYESKDIYRLRSTFLKNDLVSAWSTFLREYGTDICKKPDLINQLILNLPADNLLVNTYLDYLKENKSSSKLVQWVNRHNKEQGGVVITKKEEKYPSYILMWKEAMFVAFSDGSISVYKSETLR